MAETPYNHYALYEPDASPDLTATGEYNSAIMGIDSDMHSEREERTRIEREYKAADVRLDERITTLGNQETADVRDVNAKLVQEVTDRKAADTALDTKFTNGLNNVTNGLITVGNDVNKVESDYKAADAALIVRINNAEADISANSADLTGIKSLTYGNEHVQFLEHDNGSYSSPALDEIKHEIDDATLKVFTSTATGLAADTVLTFDKVKDIFANSVIIANEMYLFPFWTDGKTKAIYTGSRENTSGHRSAIVTMSGTTVSEHLTTWGEIVNKPFSTIGSGLTVTTDGALTASGVTVMQLSEFGELTYEDAHPSSATGEGNAAAYTKLQQAWPNVVVVDATTTWTGGMYTPASWKQNGYTLTKSTIDSTTHGTPVSMTVNGSGYSEAVRLKEIVATGITADTQWGTIEA